MSVASLAEEAKQKKPAKPIATIQTLRGFKDIVPADQDPWRLVRSTAEHFAEAYGFGEITLPVLEETALFNRSIGKQTDIVEKEMFTFADQSEGSISLRPEATASVVRAYINHGMLNLPQPVKLYYWGPMFRRERPQAGRLRQFNQFGLEVLGDSNPVLDAELINLTYNFFRQLGLSAINIQVNSIGCQDCRKQYRDELVAYYKPKRRLLCEDCKRRLVKNPLRLLDCKQPSCRALRAEAPQIVDWLDEGCKSHFMKVIEYLDGLDVPYVLNPFLVRGLDYYTKTVFEIWHGDQEGGAQSALGGGGRYDGLVEMLGGRATPALGCSIGIERVILVLKEQQVVIKPSYVPQVFIAQIGDQGKIKAMILFEKLRQAGIAAAQNFAKDSLKSQLESANKFGVSHVLILGQKEVLDGTILVRDMENGVQEIIDYNKALPEIRKKLAQRQIAETPLVEKSS